jgi:phosphoglycerate dehydrogenase-like enzyme
MARADKLHLHIENSAAKNPVFHITERLFKEACRRHPDVARRLRVSWGWDGDGFARAIATADLLIGSQPPVDLVRPYAKRLRFIHVTAAGVERWLPLGAWLPDGVAFIRNSGPHVGKAAEFVTMALLMLNTRMPEIATNQHNAHWRQIFSPRVAGKTALFIGLGHMGSAGAGAARRLGLRTLAIRRSGKPSRAVDAVYTPKRLDALLPKADFLVVTAPLTAETRSMIGRAQLARLKPAAGLVNMGRAQIVDYGALCEALTAGRLSGAILDVYEQEPLPADSPLWQTPNLVVNPHCSSDDADNYIPASLDLLFDNVRRLLAGRRLRNVVTDEKGY